VGLTHVKERIVEDEENRKALAERFHYSQQFMQDDPWQERAEGGDAHEFAPLASVGGEPIVKTNLA
jgi:nitrite reductase (NADH) large subunit